MSPDPTPSLCADETAACDRAGGSGWAERLTSTPWLLSALAVWLLATLGWRPLLLPDEGRYAEVARSMASGNLGVPLLNGLPFFHKPPLFYWLAQGPLHLFGATEFSARFGSAVGAWVMGAALWFALRRQHGPRIAALGLGVLATTPFYYFGGQYANHDMLVGGLISAAILALARALESPGHTDRRWLVTGWALCALALLSKGLIGFVLPALVIGPWLLAQGRWRQMLGLLHPLGLGVFLLIGAPWFLAMQAQFPGFNDYFFMEQHFRRYAASNFNNVHGPWFFIVVMPLLTLPWSLWLPGVWRQLRAKADPTALFYAWWAFAVLLFFTLPSSKLVGYALPALAPWCALLALAVADGVSGHPRRWRRTLVASAVLCVTVVAGATLFPPSSHRALGLALRAQLAPGDRVVMVDDNFYDVPFYARLSQPALVASRWDDPDLPRHDNWRKELFDAARFDPALGHALLWPLADLESAGCGRGAVWFVAHPESNARLALRPGARQVWNDAHTALWRVPALPCPADVTASASPLTPH